MLPFLPEPEQKLPTGDDDAVWASPRSTRSTHSVPLATERVVPLATAIAAEVDLALVPPPAVVLPVVDVETVVPTGDVPVMSEPKEPTTKERLTTALMVLAVTLMWGVGLTINSSSGSLIPSSKWRLFVSLSSFGHFCGLLIVLSIMKVSHVIPTKVDLPSVSLGLLTMLPLAILPTINSLIIYLKSTGSDISFLTPVLGMYIVVPCLYGWIFRGEKRNVLKMVGIFMAIAAISVNGVASGLAKKSADDEATDTTIEDDDEDGMALGLLIPILAGTALVWGARDIVSMHVSSKLTPALVAMLSCFGSLAVSAMTGLWYVSLGDYVELRRAHVVIPCVNACSAIAWYIFALASRRAAATTFVPIVGLHVFVPALWAVGPWGTEDITPLKVVGIALAAVAVLMIGRKPSTFTWGKAKAAVARQVMRAAMRFKTAGRVQAKWRAQVIAAAAAVAELEIEKRVARASSAVGVGVALPGGAASQPKVEEQHAMETV